MVRVQSVVRPDGDVVRRKPRAGDMRWDGKAWERWNGRRWGRAAYSLHPELLRERTRIDERPAISEQTRRRALALAVEDQVAHHGASIAFDGPSGVVLTYRRRPSLLLTLMSGGLWLLLAGGRQDRVRLEADRWGNVWAGPRSST